MSANRTSSCTSTNVSFEEEKERREQRFSLIDDMTRNVSILESETKTNLKTNRFYHTSVGEGLP